jgi:hypothetical protein
MIPLAALSDSRHSAPLSQHELERLVETHLPEFAKACRADADVIVLHQAAFAANFQELELFLLGAAIKYAGLRGRDVQIIGSTPNDEGSQS